MSNVYHWSFPLDNGERGWLVLPKRTVSPKEWRRMLAVFSLFEYGLVEEDTSSDVVPKGSGMQELLQAVGGA